MSEPTRIEDPDEYTLITGSIANGLASGLGAQELIGAMCLASDGAELDTAVSTQIEIKAITEKRNARRKD